MLISFVWSIHFSVSFPTASHWDSKSTWLVNIPGTLPLSPLPSALGHAVPSCVCAFPSFPRVVILPTRGTYQTGQSHEAFIWFPQPKLAYFPLKSIVPVVIVLPTSLTMCFLTRKTVYLSCHPLSACRLFEGRNQMLFISIFPVEALHTIRFQYLYLFINICVYSSLVLFQKGFVVTQ